jgi:hypothetical protein
VNDTVFSRAFSVVPLFELLADLSQIDDLAHRSSIGTATPPVAPTGTIRGHHHRCPYGDSANYKKVTVFFSFPQDTVS